MQVAAINRDGESLPKRAGSNKLVSPLRATRLDEPSGKI